MKLAHNHNLFRRDVVVKPNVSPGKNNSNSNSLPGKLHLPKKE